MVSFPIEVKAAVYNWSDNFDDNNYDGWTLDGGTYDASGGMLTATALMPGPAFGNIYHPSNTSMGTWSFDLHVVDDAVNGNHLWIPFMRVGPGAAFTGYQFAIELLGNALYLYKDINTQIGVYSMGYMLGYHHITVERNTTDENMFYVYHNGTLAIEGFALVVPYDWGYFSFHATIGSSIDNITVTEFVEDPTTTTDTDTESTTPEPSTTPTGTGEPLDTTMILIIAGGGVAVVVIVAIVAKMRS